MIFQKPKYVILGIALAISFPITGYSQDSAKSNDSNIRRYKMTLIPLKTEEPEVTSRAIDNSKQFLITLRTDSISVIYKKKTLPIRSAQQLDEYLKKELKTIDQTQICIFNNSANLKSFNEVMTVLKKYNILHFSFYSP